jgi:hypothetical protein
MIGGNLTNSYFQTFYASKEESSCPFISDIIRTCNKFETIGLFDNSNGIISIGYGKRIVMNGSDTNLTKLKRGDIIEIVDYDPIKKIILLMGQIEPSIDTPVHCLIHRAREDVNAIIQLNSEKLSKNLPSTEQELSSGTLEEAKEILGLLRTSKGVMIKNKGVLFVGASLKEVEELVINHMRNLNED